MSLGNDLPTATATDVEGDIAALSAAIDDVFDVHSIRRLREGLQVGAGVRSRGTTIEFLGRLRLPSDRAYHLIAERFRARGYLALLRDSLEGDLAIAVPGEAPNSRSRWWLALGLFLATLLSVLLAGSTPRPHSSMVATLFSGWPFAVSLLSILLAHEFGHYIMSRRLGIPASLPYFIPMPLSFLGTMGAVIQMKAPPHDRRALVAIAAAGPLAGLALALPLLVLGLKLSTVEIVPLGGPYIQEGNSLLYAGLKILIFGRFLPANGLDVFLHPVALAGWTGLLVTALNLIPAGQLDGGHLAYALLGQRARWLTWIVVAVLVGLSFLWNGWIIWAGLVFFLGRVHAVPMDDITRLRGHEKMLVVLLFVILALVFTPIPIDFRSLW